MSDADAPLNLVTLNELKDMLEEGLDELLNDYLDDAPQQLSKMRAAAESGDIQALGVQAHSLKGSSGSLGVTGVYELCASLEQEAKGGVVTRVAASLTNIEAELARAQEAMAAFMLK